MVQDRITKAVLRRFKELGLPPCLLDVEEFRDHFLFHRWVMFVRDGDELANVHLVQPHQKQNTLRGERPTPGRARRER